MIRFGAQVFTEWFHVQVASEKASTRDISSLDICIRVFDIGVLFDIYRIIRYMEYSTYIGIFDIYRSTRFDIGVFDSIRHWSIRFNSIQESIRFNSTQEYQIYSIYSIYYYKLNRSWSVQVSYENNIIYSIYIEVLFRVVYSVKKDTLQFTNIEPMPATAGGKARIYYISLYSTILYYIHTLP